MNVNELASAIRNNISNGLKGVTNISYSLEQIVDEIYLERNSLIKEYMIKGLLPLEELAHAIDCIQLDKANLFKCKVECATLQHFEIPKFSNTVTNPIIYIGTTDRMQPFKVYTDYSYLYHKHSRGIANKPYVWVDTALNSNGKYDGYVYNLPLVKCISVVAIWEDLREIAEYDCVGEVNMPDFVKKEILTRISERYIRYYRQLNQPIIQNNTQVSTS